MQRRVILLRHGHAQERSQDFERPLSEEGRRAARRAGEELALAGWMPDTLLTSSAPRARETAELCAGALGFEGTFAEHRSLYLATEGQYLRALQNLEPSTVSVLLVGHNPGLTALARLLCRHGRDLAPAEFASATFDLSSWSELDA